MDKIESTVPFLNPVSYTGLKNEMRKTQKKSEVKSKSVFRTLLERASEETEISDVGRLPVTEETVNQLLEDVHSTGDALRKRPLPAEILKYKQAVRNFLAFSVKNTYDIEKQYMGVSLRKRKEKTLVQIVDKKLDQLATDILAGQRDQLAILERLEEITGILVDLLQ
ncbi:MAG: YaaR family protein [Treponema sp.]|nr:YaaR family protein [Treponema sp.]